MSLSSDNFISNSHAPNHTLRRLIGRLTSKTVFWNCFIIFTLALLTRLAYLFYQNASPVLLHPLVDSKTYLALASDFLKSGNITQDWFWQSPFYPFFIAVLGWVQGVSSAESIIMSIRVIQAFLGACTAVMVFFVARKIRLRYAPFIAGVIMALYGPSVFYDVDIGPAGWAAFYFVTLLFLFISEHKGRVISFLIGLLSCLALLTRSELFPFAFMSILWTCWKIKSSFGVRHCLCFAGFVLAGFMVVAAPVLWLRVEMTGEISLLPQSGGINFYLGNNPDKEAINIRPGYSWAKMHRQAVQMGYDTVEKRSAYFFKRGLTYLVHDPFGFASNIMKKILQLFCSREIPRNEDIYVMREWSPVLRWLVWKIGPFGFPFGLLLPFFCFGYIKYRKEMPACFHFQFILVGGSLVLIFISSRYRVPMIPLFAIVAAVGATPAGPCRGWKERIRMDRAPLAVACLMFPVSLLGFYPAETVNYKAELYKILGQSYLDDRQVDKAERCYLQALALRPDFEEVSYMLGLLYETNARREEALVSFGRAPSIEEARMEIYYLLKQLGRQEEGGKYLADHIRDLSDFPNMNLEYAWWLINAGRNEEAIPFLEKSIAQKSNQAESYILLGDTYAKLKRNEDAVRIYREGASAFPGDKTLRARMPDIK